MELMESDEVRKELLRKSAQHRKELEGEVKLISENTEKVIMNALVIAGSLALTYYLVRQFSGSGKKRSKAKRVKVIQAEAPEVVEVQHEEHSSPGVLGQVGAALAAQASAFLLNIAKEKLMEYLQSIAEKKSQES
jgi:hypothetical protein